MSFAATRRTADEQTCGLKLCPRPLFPNIMLYNGDVDYDDDDNEMMIVTVVIIVALVHIAIAVIALIIVTTIDIVIASLSRSFSL